MRYLVVLIAGALLEGCFFATWEPGAFSANTCLPESGFVGQRIQNKTDGKIGLVKKLYGRSSRCQDGSMPILAAVEYE